MPILWNDVPFAETPLVEGGPDFSFLPQQESRYSMRGWFAWDDVVSQAATKAYAGWCQVANNYLPFKDDGNIPSANHILLPNVGIPPAAKTYFHYVNPFPHPDWPNQMYLCEGLGNVRGSIAKAPAAGPNGTATYDEAHTTLHFRAPKNGYRTLPDYLMLDIQAGNGAPAWGVPREYFCTRNMEIVEQVTSRAQNIPGHGGLQWQTLAANGAPGVGNGTGVSAANFITLHEGEITIHWYPVPFGGYNEAAALDLVGKCNNAAFPPTQPVIPGVTPPVSLMSQRGLGGGAQGKALATLVWGQPHKEIIRIGDCAWALKVTLKLKWFPFGANAFFWWDPPALARGRIRIDPTDGPTMDAALGGPGYYLVARPDGSFLFPPADFRRAFVPSGQTP